MSNDTPKFLGQPLNLGYWPTDRLVFYWRGIRAGKAIDESLHGNHGILVGSPTWTADGLSFDGGDRVDMSDSTHFSGSFTFIAWAKTADWHVDAESNPVFVSEVSSYSNYWAYLGGGNNSTEIQFSLYDGTNNPGVLYSSAPLDEWVQIVGVRDVPADEVRLYANGILRATLTDTTTSIPAYNALNIGQMEEITDRDFHGQIKYVSAYNRALSAGEILKLYMHPDLPMQKEPVWLAYAPPPVVTGLSGIYYRTLLQGVS